MEPLSLATIAFAICFFGLISGRAERSPLTAPLFFTAIGVGMSGLGLGWLGMDIEGEVVQGLAELTLVLVLFTDATRIDLTCLRRERALPLRLLALGLPLSILFGTAVAIWLFPSISVAEAALLATILAPTDAALGQAVVSNARVPIRIRQTLNVESGLNDGIALPLVLVLASLAGALEEGGDVAYWIQFALLAVTLGPAVGAGIGWLGGRLISLSIERKWMSPPFQRIAALGLSLLAFGGAELIGGNGFIAAFVAGLILGNTARDVCPCLYDFGEAEGQLLALLVFLIFGAALVPDALAHVGFAEVGYALLSLTLIRLLAVAVSLLGSGLRAPSVAFLGWFGPRGLASILFILLVVEPGRLESATLLETVVVLTVLLSTVLHGITAYPFAARYADYAAGATDAHEEHRLVDAHPVRIRHVVPADGFTSSPE